MRARQVFSLAQKRVTCQCSQFALDCRGSLQSGRPNDPSRSVCGYDFLPFDPSRHPSPWLLVAPGSHCLLPRLRCCRNCPRLRRRCRGRRTQVAQSGRRFRCVVVRRRASDHQPGRDRHRHAGAACGSPRFSGTGPRPSSRRPTRSRCSKTPMAMAKPTRCRVMPRDCSRP